MPGLDSQISNEKFNMHRGVAQRGEGVRQSKRGFIISLQLEFEQFYNHVNVPSPTTLNIKQQLD